MLSSNQTSFGPGPAGNSIIGSYRVLENDSGLDAINSAVALYISRFLAELGRGGSIRVELFYVVRRQLSMATTGAIWSTSSAYFSVERIRVREPPRAETAPDPQVREPLGRGRPTPGPTPLDLPQV